jgi:hypothetical protein
VIAILKRLYCLITVFYILINLNIINVIRKMEHSTSSLNHLTQTIIERICNECKKKRKIVNEIHQICHLCCKAKTIIQSGNKVIDDFIRYTLTNRNRRFGKMEFVPYDRFKDLEFIAEGGFSKIYKATWIDGPIRNWNNKKQKYDRHNGIVVALKKLNNSKNINSKELNEVKYI